MPDVDDRASGNHGRLQLVAAIAPNLQRYIDADLR